MCAKEQTCSEEQRAARSTTCTAPCTALRLQQGNAGLCASQRGRFPRIFSVSDPKVTILTLMLMHVSKKLGQVQQLRAGCAILSVPVLVPVWSCANPAVGCLLVSHCISMPYSKRRREMHFKRVILALMKKTIECLDGWNYWVCAHSNHLHIVHTIFLLR